MKTALASLSEGLRIVGAVTAKDMLDALKAKTTLSILICTLVTVAAYQLLPGLERSGDRPALLVYDAGHSSLLAPLKRSPGFDVHTGYTSQDQLRRKLVAGSLPELALALPAGFDQVLAGGEVPVLQGFVQYWVSDSDAASLKDAAEEEIARLAGGPVTVSLEGNRVYPTPDSGGRSFLASLAILVSVTMIGVMLAPHLLIEERRTRTLDALLVSPARIGHLVVAKALTGLAYCLIAAVLVLAVNSSVVSHWGLASLVVLLASLLAVSVGLLLGSLVGPSPTLPIWSGAALTVLLWPLFLSAMRDLLPEAVGSVLAWIPTATLARVIRGSFCQGVGLQTFGTELLVVAASTAVVLGGVAWVVRRSDR